MGNENVQHFMDKLMERLKGNRRLEMLAYAGLALVCMAMLLPAGDRKEKVQEQEYMPQEGKYNYYDDGLESRLTSTLSLVRGAGRVEVMVTYETGAEIVPAMSTDISESAAGIEGLAGSRTESTSPVTVYQDGENEAIVLMERMPQVRGVIVVAEGASDISVRMKLQSAVVAVLGVEASRVEVLEMGIEGMEG